MKIRKYLSPDTLGIKASLDQPSTFLIIKIDIIWSQSDHWPILCVHFLSGRVHGTMVGIVHPPKIRPSYSKEISSHNMWRVACFELTCEKWSRKFTQRRGHVWDQIDKCQRYHRHKEETCGYICWRILRSRHKVSHIFKFRMAEKSHSV